MGAPSLSAAACEDGMVDDHCRASREPGTVCQLESQWPLCSVGIATVIAQSRFATCGFAGVQRVTHE